MFKISFLQNVSERRISRQGDLVSLSVHSLFMCLPGHQMIYLTLFLITLKSIRQLWQNTAYWMQFSEILHTCKCHETRELGKKEKAEVLKALMKERLQHNSALIQPEGSHWGSRNVLGLGRSPSMFRLYQVPENVPKNVPKLNPSLGRQDSFKRLHVKLPVFEPLP